MHGAVNFSVLRNLIQQYWEEGKLNVDALESIYTIFIDNIDSLGQEANKIYDSKIKKDDKEEEKRKWKRWK